MIWQSVLELIVVFSLVKVELSESAYSFADSSLTRRSTWTWSTRSPETEFSIESPRKQRRNKYNDFSKVSDHDPLDVLISESKRKNDEIIADVPSSVRSISTSTPTEVVPPIPYAQYPDVKGIDVSFEHFSSIFGATSI